MNPTLHHGLTVLSRACSGLRRGKPPAAHSKSRRALVPQVAGLEERLLQYFGVKATVVPNTLWPPKNQYVPVTISGTLLEFSMVGNKQVFGAIPGPKKANFRVVDEYRQDEPTGPIPLVDEGKGKYSFSVTFYLQARRAEEFIAGRRYYITVAAQDRDGWGSRELHVQVPRTLQDRGPGPIPTVPSKIPPKTTHAKPVTSGSTTTATKPKPQFKIPFL